MTASPKKPLNRKLAVILAVLVLWLVGGIGLGVMNVHGWYFFLLGGYDFGTLGQIGSFYLVRVGVQVPSLGVAAFIFRLSDFPRPVSTACLTAFTFCGIMTAIHLVRQPWAVLPDLDQSIPILAEVAQLILMVGFIGFFTWFFIWFAAWLDTGALARYFHRVKF